jgi:hypothetical protein
MVRGDSFLRRDVQPTGACYDAKVVMYSAVKEAKGEVNGDASPVNVAQGRLCHGSAVDLCADGFWGVFQGGGEIEYAGL